MSNSLNVLRHQSVFSPDRFGGRRVDVVGVGAVGSRVVLSLAKLGVECIHVWDFDAVESHNVANQLFRLSDVGKKKVDALTEIVVVHSGCRLHAHDERVDGSQKLGPIVFLLPDTMRARKEIWTKGIKLRLNVELLIEARMGIDGGKIYTVSPTNITHIKEYEMTLHDDSPESVSLCGSTVSVGATAEIVSGFAVWQFMRWFSKSLGSATEDELEHEILVSLRRSMLISKSF